jgi:hypothetical protein
MTTATRVRPDATEYAPFYAGYVAAVPEGDVVAVLRDGGRELLSTVRGIPESRGGHRYAEGKWSVREVIGHITDAERIFSYRALRLARADATPLAPFDENAYTLNAGSELRTIADLVAELAAVRESTVALFASFADDAWVRRGIVSGKEISVRAIAYITAGHGQHHLGILRERYLDR